LSEFSLLSLAVMVLGVAVPDLRQSFVHVGLLPAMAPRRRFVEIGKEFFGMRRRAAVADQMRSLPVQANVLVFDVAGQGRLPPVAGRGAIAMLQSLDFIDPSRRLGDQGGSLGAGADCGSALNA
jgi:hypothetical protein